MRRGGFWRVCWHFVGGWLVRPAAVAFASSTARALAVSRTIAIAATRPRSASASGAASASRANVNQTAGTAVVITPWLSYPQDDTVFFEELARKRLIITGIFTSYFNSCTKVELLSRTVDKIKQDLVEQINEQMSLGKIEGIYFTDYIFLE